MLAVELIEIAIVGRVMFRPVPPVPIAALGNQDLLKRQLALLLARTRCILLVKLARVVQVIPGAVVLRRTNPYIEVGVDPRSRHQRRQSTEILVPRNRLRDRDRLYPRLVLQPVVKPS